LTRPARDDIRVGGLGIAVRFSLAMSAALAVVMVIAGYFLYGAARDLADRSVADVLHGTARAMAENEKSVAVDDVQIYEQAGDTAHKIGERLLRFDVRFKSGKYEGQNGHLYQWDKGGSVVVPIDSGGRHQKGLLGLVLGVTLAVILVGAVVAYMVASKVSMPLEEIVEDIRKISRGNLKHRSRVRGGGEVALLARAIDRMASSLADSQDAELELSMRERERDVALEVREALLPEHTPTLEGYDIADVHIGCPEPGGDFHEYVLVDGRVVLLVCDVSGTGVPGALVGAMARAYVRTEIERGGPLDDALKKANRDLARDVRRGMYVTALAVVIDAGKHEATVACAGHKLPLIRFSASEGNVRLIQPEGIALGFDKGAVFDQRLELQRVQIEPGDRLVLANTGPVRAINPDGEEFGEKAFYRAVMKHARKSSEGLLDGVISEIEAYADEEDFPADISILALARDA